MTMRSIGLDLGRHSGEAAIIDETGAITSLGRLAVSREALEAFAAGLGPDDQVVLEASTNTWAIADILSRHAGRVVVSNPFRTRAIAAAKVKTDEIDARTLAGLLAADYIPAVWLPDERTRELRRRVSHRAGLVRSRTLLRNRVHAILAAALIGVPVSDLFGVRGREWLAQVELAPDAREALETHLRLHDVLEGEIERAERAIARSVVDDRAVRHLLTIPGVGLTTAAALVAVIGDVSRFPRPAKLTSYLGLDPRVRQSGQHSYTGHISRAGQAHARGLLIEAAHATVRTPGPLRAFYLRTRSRRGAGVAVVAVARKLAVLAWHLLTRDEDFRWSPPERTAEKIRSLELAAGRPRHRSRRGMRIVGPGAARARRRELRQRERAVLVAAEAAYVEHVRSRAVRRDAAAATGERLDGPVMPEPAAPRSFIP
jgi:transposase